MVLLGALLLVAGAVRLLKRSTFPRADFVFCNQTEVASLDPHRATSIPDGRIVGALFEGLTRLDPCTLEALPGQADHWTVSDDGLTWRFHVRDDARWTDGSPVTADDFAASFRRLLHPATAARHAALLASVVGARAYTSADPSDMPPDDSLGIAALPDDVLEMRLVEPVPYLPSLLAYQAFAPVPLDVVRRWGSAWTDAEHIVGNGPFVLVERRLRDRIRLARNERYWDAAHVRLASIDALAANGATTQLNLLLTGDADWIVKPPPALYEALRARPEWRSGGQLGVTFLRFCTTHAPFDDARVRRALLLALDRESLARDVMRGGEIASTSYVPHGLAGYDPAPLEAADPERARALLAEAGFPGGRGFPPFELLHPHNDATRDLCAAITAMWREQLGLSQVTIASQEFGTYIDSTSTLKYDVAWSSWIGDWLDPSTFLLVFAGESGNNRTGWRDATYDALLDESARQLDPAARLAVLRRAEERLLDALPIAPLHQRANVNLVAPRVDGFCDNMLDLHPLRDLAVREPPP